MRTLIFVLLFSPLIVVGQTFEKLLNDYFYQFPTDVLEMEDSYVVASVYVENFDENYNARILKLNKENGEVTNSYTVNDIVFGQMCLLRTSDSTFLFAYFTSDEQDSLLLNFKVLNLDFYVNSIHTIKLDILYYTSQLHLFSSLAKVGENHFYFTFGSLLFSDSGYNSVFTLFSDFNLDEITYNHYKRPDFGMSSISILPFFDADTALLVFSGRAFKVNNQGQICDSFPDDFMRFVYPTAISGVGSTSAHWIESSLYLGGGGYAIAKYIIFEKDTLVRYFSHEYARAAYYEPMSVNRSKIFLTGIMGYNPSLYWLVGEESYINLFHIDSTLNLIWTRNYNVNDGYYYFPFNTLATTDGGCLIAGTRNNYNLQGRKVDLYLLKVDSLGNYTPMVGLENPTTTTNTLVYPNPGTATLTIETPEGTAGSTFRMYNSTGMLMLQHRLLTETETIDVSILPSGIYIYETQNQNGTVERGKWVKMD